MNRQVIERITEKIIQDKKERRQNVDRDSIRADVVRRAKRFEQKNKNK